MLASEQAGTRCALVADWLDKRVQQVGLAVAWCYVLLVVVILLQVMLRKGFSSGFMALEELQWHLYAVAVMFGLSYAQVTDSHVRVDLFYGAFRPQTKRWVDLFGILLLGLPFVLVVIIHSLDFVYDAWRINERSASPAGLPWRWLIKSAIPITFSLLGVSMISRLLRDISLLRQGERHGS